MTPYTVSREARRDLDAIWYAIARHNLLAADRMLVRLFDIFLHLSRSPLAGESCEELRSGLRRYLRGKPRRLLQGCAAGIDRARLARRARCRFRAGE